MQSVIYRSDFDRLKKHKRQFAKFLFETPLAVQKALFLSKPVTGSPRDIRAGREIFDTLRQTKTLSAGWLSGHVPVWAGLLSRFKDRAISVLEIGSFEGASAMWTLEYLPEAHITCIDPFLIKAGARIPGDQGEVLCIEDSEVVFDRNLASYADRVTKIVDYSGPALKRLLGVKKLYDFIYIDGSHTAADCLQDSLLSWPMLKPNGLMIWDDYLWEMQKFGKNTPTRGVNEFLRRHSSELEIIHARYQVAVIKRA